MSAARSAWPDTASWRTPPQSRSPGWSMKCRASFPGWIRTWRRASPPTWRSGCGVWRRQAAMSRWSKRSNGRSTNTAWSSFGRHLATIIDRLETDAFEIAVFGRVSSGKSSLLNHIVGQDLLPVGVNPITAVPTRLAYGPEPRATAWFADRKPEQFGIERLAEFVTEQHNPANIQHVTRIVVELPAQAASGRRCLCGHAGSWVACHFRRRRNQGLSSPLRFGRRADRCRVNSDRGRSGDDSDALAMPASPRPCC